MAVRNANGQFAKGQSGNPKGRAKKERETEYLAVMQEVVSPAQWRRICEKAVKQAIEGHGFARKWISDYLLGTPVQRTEITGLDGGALANEIIVRYADNNFAETSSVADAGEEGEETI